jgi:hypothetical protein
MNHEYEFMDWFFWICWPVVVLYNHFANETGNSHSTPGADGTLRGVGQK